MRRHGHLDPNPRVRLRGLCAHHVHALFEDLPPSSTVLDDYVRFLYHIGEQSLPEAFVRIAKRLQL